MMELLSDQYYSPAQVEQYVREIRESSKARAAGALLRENLAKLNDTPGDYRAILDKAKEGLEDQIRAADQEGGAVPSMREVLMEVEEEIFNSPYRPIPTFSRTLNENLNGGLQRGKVFTIVAPAGGGKTTFALQLLDEVARSNGRRGAEPLRVALYLAMEPSRAELLVKSYSRLGKINGGEFEKGLKPDHEKVKGARSVYAQEIAPYLYLVQGGEGITLRDVRALVRKVSGQIREAHQLVLCIDPFQLLKSGDHDLDKEEISRVGAVAAGLKILARDLKISVLLLSDTTKAEAEKMAKGEETATGIRGSYMGQQRTDISAVLLVYEDGRGFDENRSADHKRLADVCGAYINSDPGKATASVYAVLAFSKQRSGSVWPVPFLYKKAYNQFIPVEDLTEER